MNLTIRYPITNTGKKNTRKTTTIGKKLTLAMVANGSPNGLVAKANDRLKNAEKITDICRLPIKIFFIWHLLSSAC